MGQPHGHRHEVGRLVAGEAEHHPLVAGSHPVERVDPAPAALQGVVHSLGDVRRLPVDGHDNPAGVAVEAVGFPVVADLADRLSGDPGNVDIARGGDLSGHDDEPGGEQRLTGDPGLAVLPQDGVEDGVGDLVGHLVGMAFGDGLRGKGEASVHVTKPPAQMCGSIKVGVVP